MDRQSRRDGWRAALALYGDRRMLVILLMGFSSGLPLLLGFSTLSYWLSREGVSLTVIGGLLASSVPYSVKFLWAPLIDQVRLPVFTAAFGRRRARVARLFPKRRWASIRHKAGASCPGKARDPLVAIIPDHEG